MKSLLNKELLTTAVIDRMDAMVRVMDEDRHILYMNNKMKREFGNFCGHSCYEMIGQCENCAHCVTMLARESGDTESKEMAMGDKWYRLIASSVQLENSPKYSVEFFVDITKQKKLEEANRRHFDRLTEDIEFAKQIQYNALPRDGEYYNTIDVASIYRPAESLGGDFFDVVKIDQDRVLFYVSDVAGHGVRSSLLTIFLHQVIRGMKERAGELQELVRGILQGMNDLHAGHELYLTVLVGLYDKRTRELTVLNAVHNCLPLVEDENGRLEEIEVYGMPICSLFDSAEYETVTRVMRPGQRLLFYTDGIPEATNVQGDEFGLEGILRIWDAQDIKSPQQLLAALQARVVEFSGFAPEDDMTAVLVEFL